MKVGHQKNEKHQKIQQKGSNHLVTASRPEQHLKEPDELEDCKSISAFSEAGEGVKEVIWCCHYEEGQYLTAKEVLKVVIVPEVAAKGRRACLHPAAEAHTPLTGAVWTRHILGNKSETLVESENGKLSRCQVENDIKAVKISHNKEWVFS